MVQYVVTSYIDDNKPKYIVLHTKVHVVFIDIWTIVGTSKDITSVNKCRYIDNSMPIIRVY